MDTIDWAVQGTCLPAASFLLYRWWNGDELVHKLAPAMLLAQTCIMIIGLIAYTSYTVGAINQANADLQSVKTAYEGLAQKVRAKTADSEEARGILIGSWPAVKIISKNPLTSRSYLALAALFLVLNFLAIVQIHRKGKPDGGSKDGVEGHGD